MVMQKTVWAAADNQLFDTQQQAQDHEAGLNGVAQLATLMEKSGAPVSAIARDSMAAWIWENQSRIRNIFNTPIFIPAALFTKDPAADPEIDAKA